MKFTFHVTFAFINDECITFTSTLIVTYNPYSFYRAVTLKFLTNIFFFGLFPL